jgi:selenium metabolism protein YedF
MKNTLDLKGLSCPLPVVKTREFLDGHPETLKLEVLVDNEASGENVKRFLETRGFGVEISGENGVFRITASLGEGSACEAVMKEITRGEPKTLILVTKDRVGSGDDTLGAKLMVNFLATLHEMGEALWRVVFVNSGVKLTVNGSEVLPSLQALEKAGVSILVCGTCLNHFDLLKEKAVGQTTNMLDIVTSLQVAGKVITI